MKVLHVIPSVSFSRGGPSRAVLDIVHGLVRAGITVHLATTDDDGSGHLSLPLSQPTEEDGVTCWYFPRQTRFYMASWPLTAWLQCHVADYDLVHIHAVFRYSPLPAAFYARRAGVPYIVTPHGILKSWGVRNRRPLLKRLSFCLIESRILRHAALVHYTSQQERSEAEQLGIRTPSAVIPLGIDYSTFERLPEPSAFRCRYPQLKGRTLILFLSRLGPIKGLDLLLPAFAQVRQAWPDVALVLAGSGASDYELWLRARVRELRLEGDVLFTGFLEGEQRLAALVDCDIFALPSYSESFGVAVAEAMACGKPVLISDCVGIHHEIAQGGAGLVVPCRVGPLAEAIAQLARDRRLRIQLGENGRRLAAERFSLKAMTSQLVNVYTEIAHGK